MDKPFDEFLAVAEDKQNPELWIYCHPDYLKHFIESEKLIEQTVEKDIFWFLYQGARIGVRPLRDVQGYYLLFIKKEDLNVEKLATKELIVPRDLALNTYFHYCEEEMN